MSTSIPLLVDIDIGSLINKLSAISLAKSSFLIFTCEPLAASAYMYVASVAWAKLFIFISSAILNTFKGRLNSVLVRLMIKVIFTTKMIYAYIRVSTDKQTVENQKFEIEKFCKVRELQIDKWVSEIISGTKSAKERKLGTLLKKLKKGDTLICSEISRLGRRLMEVMSILNTLMQKNITVLTVKEKYELGNNIQSQILAFAFSLSAQIERDLISQRTREGLARRVAEGQKLGRHKGGHNSHYKLTGKEGLIKTMLEYGYSKAAICRKLKCNPKTLDDHLRRMEV